MNQIIGHLYLKLKEIYEAKQMVMIKVTDKEYSMGEDHKANLDYLVKCVKHDWDAITLYDGVEGVGKTTKAVQDGYYESYSYNPKKHSFGLSNVVFTVPQFEQAVTTLSPGSCIIWDEAVFGALGIEWASIVNKTITKLMVTIRKKKLFIKVVIPWIYMLQPYLAIGRTRALIHCYTPDGLRRGYFRLYNYKQKQSLYFRNKKFFTYNGVRPEYRGTFSNTKGMFYDEVEYEAKKDNAIKSITEEAEKGGLNDRYKEVVSQRNRAINALLMHRQTKEVAEITSLNYSQIRNIANYNNNEVII